MSKVKYGPYRFFFMKLLLLVVVLFAMDFFSGSLLGKYYFKLNRGDYYRTTYSIDSTKADVLIFGNSRANHHYSPAIIESRLNMSCYNAGRDASSIFYHYAVLKAILKRSTPKLIILDLHNEEFLEAESSYDRLSFLLPYYRNHPEIRPIVELKSPYEKYKLLSRIYPYNSLISIIASGNIQDKERDDVNGYLPLMKNWKEPAKIETPAAFTPDKNKLECYESFINDCKRSGIRLYVVISPRFIKLAQAGKSVVLGAEIAQKNGIPFYDYSRDPFFVSDISLFADEIHLNGRGAEIFTNMVVDRMGIDK